MQTSVFTPKDATKLSAKIGLAILNFFGWKLRYNGLPTARGVMILYPHTSNWDFIWGILSKMAIAFPLRFLAKEKLFRGAAGFFIGWFIRYCGGEPAERSVSTGAISKIVERMRQEDLFWLVIAPEGTRSYKPYWRSGFYHIAKNAQVPLVCAFIDYPKKEIGILQVLDLTGDEAVDLENLRAVYKDVRGRHPDQQCPIQFKS